MIIFVRCKRNLHALRSRYEFSSFRAQALAQVNSITKAPRPAGFPSDSPRVHAVKLYSITGVLNIARAVGYEG